MLGSADVDRSVEFYRDVLGLALSGRFEDFAFFRSHDGVQGETQLAISGELGRRATEGNGVEVVFGAKSVVETHAQLSARGVQFVNEPRPVNDANWAVSFRDPDGHLLSLYGAR
jgi:catechol 2,3-dioxygenase-like lactoylglutathione lyase family enzyme